VDQESLERCYLAAMRILAHRFNAVEELRRKLAGKRFDAETVDATLTRLRAERWLDDERFAGAFVRTRASRKMGRRRIARELGAAGVGDEAVRSAIAQHVDDDREREALVEICHKRMRILSRREGEEWLKTDEGQAKLAGFLVRQGYETALVFEVIRECLRAQR
jgi:regulatory protein